MAAALKGYGLISIDSALHFPRSHQLEGYKRLLSLFYLCPYLYLYGVYLCLILLGL